MTITSSTSDDLRSHVEDGSALVAAVGDDVVEQARVSLRWAQQRFGDRLVVASSMGDEVLVHLASVAAPGVDILFLDTGYHFPETIGTRDAVAAVYDVHVRTLLPLVTLEEQAAEHGPDLWQRDPDACCAIRKVEPLGRALAGRDAWITGVRREQSPTRANARKVEWDERHGLWKFNPLADWTDRDVWRRISERDLPYNPLHDRGYSSIGCTHCTLPGAGREGRWAGGDKTECGLHT